jgi:hypothetical protein
MKPTSSFKMSKQTKRFLALLPFKDQHERAAFKRSSIQAQLAAEQVVRTRSDKSARDE